MRLSVLFSANLVLLFSSVALADVRPLLPNEKIIYETVNPAHSSMTPAQIAASDRQFFSQITGNALSEEGDEIILDKGNNLADADRATYRQVTNIAIGTQTFDDAGTLEYTPAFLEVTIYANDGAPDLPGDGAAVEAPPNADTQPPNLAPRTVIARSRILGPTYPAGGVGRSDSFVNNFVINFPFNNVIVPEKITVAIVYLDHNGNPDITYGVDPITRLPVAPGPGQQPSFRFGTWQDVFVLGAPALPAIQAGDPENNENPGAGAGGGGTSIYNTNIYGDSRTGANLNRFSNPGHWNWIEYPAKGGPTLGWESDRNNNAGMEMTIYAVVPEPGTVILAGLALGTLLAVGTRRRRTK